MNMLCFILGMPTVVCCNSRESTNTLTGILVSKGCHEKLYGKAKDITYFGHKIKIISTLWIQLWKMYATINEGLKWNMEI